MNAKESEKLIFKSKVKYIEEGEKSTKYFLKILNRCKVATHIPWLIINGKKITNLLENKVKGFYDILYKNKDQVLDMNRLDNVALPTLENNIKEMLDSQITLEEIREALFSTSDSCPEI